MTHDNNDNSFIADNSTPRQRTLRLTALGLCWNISRPISFPLGSWLFDSGGYVTVFSVSLLLFILASALGIWGVWGFREKMEKEAASFKGVISFLATRNDLLCLRQIWCHSSTSRIR